MDLYKRYNNLVENAYLIKIIIFMKVFLKTSRKTKDLKLFNVNNFKSLYFFNFIFSKLI